jgi:AcrR family transcriptional regulator
VHPVNTQLRLIEAAERLIAERGVHGVSLREIGAEAGQRNTGAVRYHFGSKEQLVSAVFQHRMAPINEHRVQLLDEQPATTHHDERLRGLIEAFLYPLARMLGEPGRPSWYLRFCVQAAYVEDTAATNLDGQIWTQGAATVRREIQQLLRERGVPPSLIAERWELASGHITRALADREFLLQYAPQRVTTPRDVFLAHLTDTATALAAAPVSGQTARQIDDRRSA